MEFIYRNKRYIARIALIPSIVILLVALNFQIEYGAYSKSGIDGLIANHMEELQYCILSNHDNRQNLKDSVQIKSLLDIGFSGIIADCILLLFTYFIWKNRSKFFCERKYTLVSLCVRMDE